MTAADLKLGIESTQGFTVLNRHLVTCGSLLFQAERALVATAKTRVAAQIGHVSPKLHVPNTV